MTTPVAIFSWGKLRHCVITGPSWSTAAQLQPPGPRVTRCSDIPQAPHLDHFNGEQCLPHKHPPTEPSAWAAPDVTGSMPGALQERWGTQSHWTKGETEAHAGHKGKT